MKRILAAFFLTILTLAPLTQAQAGYVSGYYRSNGTYVQGYYRNSPSTTSVKSVAAKPIKPVSVAAQKKTTSAYYVNSSNKKVQSPTLVPTKPSGASAKCRDASYSFSQHRSGTCSGHGGVASWY